MQILKVDSIIKANTFIKRFRGYMFKDEPKDNEVLILTPCNQIHTLNMRFHLDVLFLDEEHRVLEKHLNIQPGRILKAVKGAKVVVEAKAGLFESISSNERIGFER